MTAPSPSMSARIPPNELAQLNLEIQSIDKNTLQTMKMQLGLADKDFPSLSVAEKVSSFLLTSFLQVQMLTIL